MLGVTSMSLTGLVKNLFSWGNVGVIDEKANRQTGLIQTLMNAPKYGASSLGLANVSDNGTNIGIKAKVSPFSLLCDTLELFFRGN